MHRKELELKEVGLFVLVIVPWFNLAIDSIRDFSAREALAMSVGMVILYLVLVGLYTLFVPKQRR